MALPFCDLAISHTLLEPQTQRERVSWAIKLGWDVVGLVHQAAAKLTQQDGCRLAACATLATATHPACLLPTLPPELAGGSRAAAPKGTDTWPALAPHRCAIRPVELQALLSAVQGVREALAAAEQRAGKRHGDPYTVRQLTRINIPADDPATAQASLTS